VLDLCISSFKPLIHEAKIVVALEELVGVAMYVRNPTELHCNFRFHLAIHNKVHCLSFDSCITIAMEPTSGSKLLHESKA